LRIEQLSEQLLRILLDAEELAFFELNPHTLSAENPHDRKAVYAVLRHAQRKNSLPLEEKTLTVETFPSENGGCVLFVWMEEEKNMSTISAKKEEVCFLSFDSLDALGKCAIRLFEKNIGHSDLYRMKNRYYLKLSLSPDKLFSIRRLGSEYGIFHTGTPFFNAVLSEHGTLLCRSDAIVQIAKISC